MDYQALYRSKLGTLQGALDLVRSGDCIAGAGYGNEPTNFFRYLHTVADRVENVCLWGGSFNINDPVMSDNSLKGRIDVLTFFYGAAARIGHDTGRYSFVPANLHSAADATIRTARPTLFACSVSPMDETGNVYLSVDLQASLELMDAADKVIFEVNPEIPRVYGQTAVSIEKATYIYEVNNRPMPLAPPTPASPVEQKIAEYVSSLIHDGDCIQLGIGGVPGAVGELLVTKQDLGIHTEMITASMGRLMRAGAVTNARKTLHPGKTVGAFAWGDQDLYDFIADNPMIELRPAAYTNDPFIIAQNDNMVSVNTALQLDLTGQICSESMGSRQYSGTGGASDFAYGAYHSKGGRGIIALQSTAKGGTVSKIQAQLTPGAIVSISRNLVDNVVTEYGIAPLRGRSVRQRVENLIAVAHPDFRAELRRQANELMLW